VDEATVVSVGLEVAVSIGGVSASLCAGVVVAAASPALSLVVVAAASVVPVSVLLAALVSGAWSVSTVLVADIGSDVGVVLEAAVFAGALGGALIAVLPALLISPPGSAASPTSTTRRTTTVIPLWSVARYSMVVTEVVEVLMAGSETSAPSWKTCTPTF
jgi:hypothetical protein